ncbi:VCBS repeat-containing protein [Emticicia aquatica]|uniref:VCBS repeat-containing protein n=1 Tax=Emticicia aquatica TaxID=1681835 RepID=UPI001EEB9857|nr:VCBS repeat-containing protein [Emticicia aquatica]
MLSSSETGVKFVNKVEENDEYNVLEYMNIYTGAGVAAGDINNDGLPDLFFSGNQTSCKLYLNKGALNFEDITEKAGLKTDRWCTGVSMVDINQDGWLDIYVNVSGSPKFGNLANLLYVNNGRNAKGEITFTEKAEEYGIAEKRQTMNASFFDYDKDGDLDLFLITNPADEMLTGVNSLNGRKLQGESAGTDILYRNDGNQNGLSPRFTDVSKEAGILNDGYSLGCAISDVNGDGFPDIYVSNDFLSNDILYINNQDGTFTDKASQYLKHTSFASMGNDIADFNNDGLPDICVLDMLPEDNFRKKMLIPTANYDKFQLSLKLGYNPSYTRNTLQLNNGNQTFSEIAFLSGVSATDWSWSSLLADYDNDGDKDLMVTNGFYRDLGNLDYINYQASQQSPMGTMEAKRKEKLKAIHNLDNVPLQNYLFENNGNLTFTKRSDEWGFTEKGFSNGACYADLDNDGDLDLVINCFNSEAKIYKNRSNERSKNNFLTVKFNGKKPNLQGIDSKVWLFSDGKMQFQELNPYRGYESTMDTKLVFGLGKTPKIDSVVVEWSDGKRQTIFQPKANQVLIINYLPQSYFPQKTTNELLFNEIADKLGINYDHQENNFADFKEQVLLPHLHSKLGPFIAVGDINGDKLEDFYVGAASGYNGSFFIQSRNGSFNQKVLTKNNIQAEETGVLLFDADNDKDLDLYTVSGGSENPEGSDEQQDSFYENEGNGNFHFVTNSLPDTKASGSCVSACDFDKDGDLDLFVGGRVRPNEYPLAPRSYLLKNSKGKFIDITPPELQNIGMVTSAIWIDYDNDGWHDLLLAGEFMPITLFKNGKGKVVHKSEIVNSSGWWNSLAAGDFDNDGDIDFIAGNLGLNTRYRASVEEPLSIYAKDFDKNGRIDPIMGYFVQHEKHIFHTRDELITQIPAMKSRFTSYEKYAQATFVESFLKEEIANAYVLQSVCFESSYFENKGNGQFKRIALPIESQFAPVNGILIGDYNNDSHLDILLAGNSYDTETSTGRYDAGTGLLLTGNGKGDFNVNRSAKTGFIADKDVKSLAEIRATDGSKVILVGNNSAKIEAYKYKKK